MSLTSRCEHRAVGTSQQHSSPQGPAPHQTYPAATCLSLRPGSSLGFPSSRESAPFILSPLIPERPFLERPTDSGALEGGPEGEELGRLSLGEGHAPPSASRRVVVFHKSCDGRHQGPP